MYSFRFSDFQYCVVILTITSHMGFILLTVNDPLLKLPFRHWIRTNCHTATQWC